jgi:hypothetical protein
MALKDILYTPVEPLNHAVGLRRLWWGQTVVDAKFGAQRVKLMFAGRRTLAQAKEAVSELLTIIRKNGANVQRTRALKVTQETSGIGGRFVAIDTNEHPPRGAIDGDKQIPA